MNRLSVTVIIPTYNRARLLIGALKSVLDQTYAASEIIVVDDGSTDDTESVLREFLAQHTVPDGLIRYERRQNQGKSCALNRGMAQASGEWIAILDSDDLWLPQKLELQLKAIKECDQECGICFTDAEFTNHPGMKLTAFQRAGKLVNKPLGVIPNPVSFVLNDPHGIYIQTVLMRSSVVRSVGDFDARLRISEDTDYLFRLAFATPFCFLNQPLVQIDRTVTRVGSLTELFQRDAFRIEQRRYMYEKWLSLTVNQPASVRAYIRQQLRGVFSEEANMHLMNGDPQRAVEVLDRARQLPGSTWGNIKWTAVRLAPQLVAKGVRLRARMTKPKSF